MSQRSVISQQKTTGLQGTDTIIWQRQTQNKKDARKKYRIGMVGKKITGELKLVSQYQLYRQIVGIPMGTNCAPLVAYLFLFCYERDFVLSLSDKYQANVIEMFNSTSRYLDNFLNIDPYFEQMVSQILIYPHELQLNKTNLSGPIVAQLRCFLSSDSLFVESHLFSLLRNSV